MALETQLWDPLDFLKTDEAIAEYLAAALEDGDPALIASTISDIARIKNIGGADAGDLRLTTALDIVRALGLKLRVAA